MYGHGLILLDSTEPICKEEGLFSHDTVLVGNACAQFHVRLAFPNRSSPLVQQEEKTCEKHTPKLHKHVRKHTLIQNTENSPTHYPPTHTL